MEEAKYICVDKAKLEQMQQHCLCSFERPIVAVPLDFKIPGSNSFTSGYLMITCGCHYLFKGKPFGHILLAMKFNIFQVNIIHFTIEQIIFDFSDFAMMTFSSNTQTISSSNIPNTTATSLQKSSNSLIFLKTHDVSNIIRASMFIQKYITYDIKDVRICRLDSTISINDIELKEKPKDELRSRTVFFAHYYNNEENDTLNVDYFRYWEKKRTPYLIINSKLKPGKFARSFGHSIAWERSIYIVSFRSFLPEQFSEFFDSLISNCDSNSTISEIQFDDYFECETLPEFNGRPLKNDNCSVKRYVFRKVLGSFVLSFLEKCSRLPKIEELILCKVKIDTVEFTQLCNLVLHNEGMKNTLKSFIIERSNIQSFPMSDFGIMLSCLSRLETISICDFKIDSVRFIKTICMSKVPVRTIHLNRQRFLKSFDEVTFPDTLIHLDVSMSLFSDEAISSLLACLTKKPVKIPIIFSAIRIILKKSSYPAIGRIALDKCYPTICEFNFSFNRIPAFGSRSLFAFLFTQKKLRNFALNSVGTTDSIKLLKNIMMIILSLKIPGFAFSPASEKVLAVLNKSQTEKTDKQEQSKTTETTTTTSSEIKEEDDLLSFDFETPATTSHSSNFADDLISLDFTQPTNNSDASNPPKSANDLLSLNGDTKNHSSNDKKSQKAPPKVMSVEPATILQFIEALVEQKVTFLRRLSLPISRTGDAGIIALTKLIDSSPKLNEIIIDGIEPGSIETFERLWEKIVEHRSIVACDFPNHDLEFLKSKIESEDETRKKSLEILLEKIKKKKSPSTANKRVKYMTETCENADEEMSYTGDIYEKCAYFNYKGRERNEAKSNTNNNDDSKDKEEVWENSQIGNDNDNGIDDLLDFEELD